MTGAEITVRLARSLQIARTGAGYSQQQLADLIGPPIQRTDINALENGRRRISERRLLQLMEVLDHDISWWYADHRKDALEKAVA